MNLIPTETEIISDICATLEKTSICFWRSNNGATFDRKKGSYRALPKYCKPGAPDINVIINGMYIGIEVKRPTIMKKGKLKDEIVDKRGGVMSEAQEDFKKYITTSGGIYVVLDSEYKLKCWLSGMGLVPLEVQKAWKITTYG